MKKAKETATGEALVSALGRRGWSQLDLARALGVNSGTVNNWCMSRRRPSLPFALEIHALLGIPLNTWAKRRSPVHSDHGGPQRPGAASPRGSAARKVA